MSTINHTAGDTIEIDVDIVNRDGEPVVLDGSEFTFTGRTSDGVVILKTELDGITINEDVVGRVGITLDPEDTDAFTAPRNILWDLQMIDVFGAVRTVAKGRIAISLQVSEVVSE